MSSIEKNPKGLIKGVPTGKQQVELVPTDLKGRWVRMIPRTGRQVQYLQMLEPGIEKCAPANGNGLLVRADRMPT